MGDARQDRKNAERRYEDNVHKHGGGQAYVHWINLGTQTYSINGNGIVEATVLASPIKTENMEVNAHLIKSLDMLRIFAQYDEDMRKGMERYEPELWFCRIPEDPQCFFKWMAPYEAKNVRVVAADVVIHDSSQRTKNFNLFNKNCVLKKGDFREEGNIGIFDMISKIVEGELPITHIIKQCDDTLGGYLKYGDSDKSSLNASRTDGKKVFRNKFVILLK